MRTIVPVATIAAYGATDGQHLATFALYRTGDTFLLQRYRTDGQPVAAYEPFRSSGEALTVLEQLLSGPPCTLRIYAANRPPVFNVGFEHVATLLGAAA